MHKRQDGLTASPRGSNHDIKQRHGAEKGIPTVRMSRVKEPDAEPFSKCTTEHSTGDRVTHQVQVRPFRDAPNLGKEANMHSNNRNGSAHFPPTYCAVHFLYVVSFHPHDNPGQ